MQRYITFLVSIYCVFSVSAQHPITKAIYNLMDVGNIADAERTISQYNEKELALLPDSILFDYYYLQAVIQDNKGEEARKRKLLISAKDLCEYSLGIHSPVYLELCWAIGDSFEKEGDIVSAFEIYQMAAIESIGLYTLGDEDVKWQYEEIEQKLKKWYQDDSLRSEMIRRRRNIVPRAVTKDTLQNDVEFYLPFYADDALRLQLEHADSLNSAQEWEQSAKLYVDIANQVSDYPIAQATVQELAATCFLNKNDLLSAEQLLTSNLELLNSNSLSKTYRRTLSLLSNVYNALHNYKKAKDYARKAKFMYEQALDFSRGYILCLHRCAKLEHGSGNYYLALLLEDVAIQEYYKKSNWEPVTGYGQGRNSFLCELLSGAAVQYSLLGFYTTAAQNLIEAIEIAERNNLDAATYYSNLSETYMAMKDFKSATIVAHKAYDSDGMEWIRVETGIRLGLLQFLSRERISKDVLTETANTMHRLVDETFSYTTTEERHNYWTHFQFHYPILNWLMFQCRDDAFYGQIYNNILHEKGLLLRTSNQLKAVVLGSGNADDIEEYNRLLSLRQLLIVAQGAQRSALEKEIEQIDKLLTRKYSCYSEIKESNSITWRDIQDNLGENDIAIEFYNIPSFKWHDDGQDFDAMPRFCAITLKRDYIRPHIIPLCEV